MATAPPPPAPVSSASAPGYPVTFDVEYPERLSRWKVLVKWLLAIPHFIIVYLLSIVNSVLVVIAFFAILFTKKWPRSLFDFSLQIQRWTFNTYAYGLLDLRDEYPPFSGEAGQYPLLLEVEYDENLSRWQIFVKWWLFALPHYLILALLWTAAVVVWIIGFFAILITGRYPRGLSISSWASAGGRSA